MTSLRPRPLVAAVLLALATSPALAQSATTDDKTKQLDTLVVTGTRVSDRTVAESQSPIDVITPEMLEATGTTELATALARAIPSLNFPRPAITDGTDAVRPAQLRGLSPDQVLVLVNGKRYHTGALVNLNGSQGRGAAPADLNTIPIASVERVEVLRDGASALYGSDAIAGVINIVLKGSGKGGSVQLVGGQYSAGDGAQGMLAADAGFHLGAIGSVHLAAQAGHQNQTDRAKPYLGVVEQRYGDPKVNQGAFSYNGELRPADYITFYSWGMASRREVLSNGYFRFAGDNRNIPAIYPDGFLPQIYNVTEDQQWVGGLKSSTSGGLTLDLSASYGHNKLTFDVLHSLNNSMGTASPTDFYAGLIELTQYAFNADFNKQLDWGLAYPVTLAFGAEARGEEFTEGAGEPASYINGGVPSANGSFLPGAQVFPGFQPGDAGTFSRNSYAYYVDLEADITDKFSAGLAGRYEHFSDFGGTSNGKLSMRYAFTPKVALRATASTGFRAPSLPQLYFQSIATNFIAGVPYDIGTFRTNNPAAIALGAEPLKPEKSTNLSLGVVLQPTDALYVTVDAYQIKITDQVVLSENLTSTAVRNYLQANGFPGIGGGRYFTNAVDTTTRGVDIVGSYRFDLAGSPFDLTASFNYNKIEVDKIAPNPAALMAIDPTAVRIGQAQLTRITRGAPRDKFVLGGEWRPGPWTLTANLTRWGDFVVYNSPTATPVQQDFSAKWTLDLAATYTLGAWSFTLGGDNVTNAYPDQTLVGQGTRPYLPYPTNAPFGFNGAYVYGRIGYKW